MKEKRSNFLANIFLAFSNVINGSEKSLLDLLSALVPYFVPVIPAYLTFFHTRDQMQFPDQVAWTAAFVVEVLGITSISTAIRFYRWNVRYKDAKNKAPFWLALGTYVFYLVIVLAVNVMLEVVSGVRTGAVIWAIALFSLMSVPSGVLISIRTQFSEMLEERESRRGGGVAGPVVPAGPRAYPLDTSRPKIERVCPGCGKSFVTTFPNKLTCSDACRKRVSRNKGVGVS